MDDLPQIDPVSALTAAFSAWLGVGVAMYVGPWSVVVLAALGGSAWAVATKESKSRVTVVAYLFGATGLSLMVTIPLTTILAKYTGLDWKWLLAPMAALIAAKPLWIVEQIRDAYYKWKGVPSQSSAGRTSGGES